MWQCIKKKLALNFLSIGHGQMWTNRCERICLCNWLWVPPWFLWELISSFDKVLRSMYGVGHNFLSNVILSFGGHFFFFEKERLIFLYPRGFQFSMGEIGMLNPLYCKNGNPVSGESSCIFKRFFEKWKRKGQHL